jgi:ATP-dependent DNA helicase RecG
MKTAQELFEQLNSIDENVRIEANKASEIDKGIMETVCAFANEPNLGGGYLLLGAVRTGFRDDLPVYEPENIDNPDKVQNDLISKCSSMLNMHIRPQVETEVVDGKTVIVVKIDELPDSQKPVYFLNKGLPNGAYRRVGASDQKCTEDDMRVFYSSAESFDSTVVKGATLDDIDENAVAHYRKLRARVNPNAEELSYDDKDLLLALRACEKEKNGEYVLTYTGLVVFGKSMSLRRLLPALRVDYIRVPGNRWIEDPDKRFEATIDMRGPLILLVNRALNAVKDDLPKGFELPKGKLQANTPIDLPDDVLREVLVNAFIHCSFRLNQPIQIIRYSNRLEVINPGFSLKSPETLGEPGSVQRNPFISTIFHDTNLAETKGSGIRSIRGHMKKAGLMPPTFESNRSANQFTARLLLHHLLDKETLQWLSSYASYSLNDEQRLALVFLREVGAIDNITYRQLNSDINNQRASYDLHFMCTKGLLEQKGQSRSTYYIAGENFISSRLYEENSRGDGENGNAIGEMCRADGENSKGDGENGNAIGEMCRAGGIENSRGDGENGNAAREMCRADGIENSRGDGENGNASGEMCRANEEMCRANGEMCRAEDLPKELKKRVGETGKRMVAKDMESLIIDLCTFKPLSLAEMASLLHRDMRALRYHYINTLIKQKRLFYTIPEMLNHPNQKYTAVKNK